LPLEREAQREVHLALGMPANERMDWLVEKATELGVASIQPLVTERGVLKLTGQRADKKLAHWQSIAVAACEQCGRNRVPVVHALVSLTEWLKTKLPDTKFLLSLRADSQALQLAMASIADRPVVLLSGPEGGLTPAEEAAALSSAFVSIGLGQRTLRAETAPLGALAALTLLA
jgi:16S rRNA (uracil1498-N3)-methyltransferase